MILELPNEIINILVKDLGFHNLIILELSCQKLHNEKLITKKMETHFVNNFDINNLIINSNFNKNLFYKHIDNIEHNLSPDRTIPFIDIVNDDSNNTSKIFKILLSYAFKLEKTQFRNYITTHLIKFYKRLFASRWDDYPDLSNRIFFNFIKHRDIYNWEQSAIDLYCLYQNLNFIFRNEIDKIDCIDYITNDKEEIINTLLMVKKLGWHILFDSEVTSLLPIFYINFISNDMMDKIIEITQIEIDD